MIFQVVADLRAFLIFFFTLVWLFTLIFAVLQAGNYNMSDTDFYEFYQENESEGDYPNEEYKYIGLFFGYFASTLRTSLGDFDFGASYFLSRADNFTYWLIWFIVVVIMCIIFLNFIIAEASASYQNVKDNLEALINKEKSQLVSEAETMMPDHRKNPALFPKFIIIRKEDN